MGFSPDPLVVWSNNASAEERTLMHAYVNLNMTLIWTNKRTREPDLDLTRRIQMIVQYIPLDQVFYRM